MTDPTAALSSGATIRPVDPGMDLALISALFIASDIADVGEPDSQADWLVETWRGSSLVGAWVAERDGVALGYLEVERVDGASAVDLFCVIDPSAREGPLRRDLIGFAHGRIADLDGIHVLRLSGSAIDTTVARDAAATGYRQARTFWHLERSLTDLPPPEALPEGVAIRASVDPDDDHTVFTILDEAFRGHYGFEPMAFDAWLAYFKDGMYDPELVLLATVDGVAAGAAVNWLPDGLGWVGDLGVREAFRGRGLGRALLWASFAVLADRGATVVRLNVDGDNETGATGLYTSVGMRERRRFDVYEKPAR